MNIRDVKITCADKFQLAATLFECTSKPKLFVLICSATGVARQFYNAFAAFLCEQHACHVLTFDYRGICESKPVTVQANIETWARSDLPAVMQYIEEMNTGKLDLVVVGQSVGIHILAITYPYVFFNIFIFFSELHAKIKRIAGISANSAYIGYFKWSSIFSSLFFMYVLRPILSMIYGYVPCKKLGMMEDLPSGMLF